MDQHADIWTRFWVWVSYSVPSGIVIGDVMGWLNDNAGMVASITAVVTMFINWVYQHRKDQRDRNHRIEQLKKAYQWPTKR